MAGRISSIEKSNDLLGNRFYVCRFPCLLFSVLRIVLHISSKIFLITSKSLLFHTVIVYPK
jgi:hypothetical protein